MINMTPTNPIKIINEVIVAAAKPIIPNINVPAIKRSNESTIAPKTPARAPLIAPLIASPPTMYPTIIPAKSSPNNPPQIGIIIANMPAKIIERINPSIIVPQSTI